jgi:hypothetical protein
MLLAARLMASLAGLVTIGMLSSALNRIGGFAAACWGAWLWALLPLAVWHERLALQDPFVTAALAGALALLVRAQDGDQTGRSIGSFAAGLLFGLAFLLKISAILALPWLGLLYFALRRHHRLPLADRSLALLAFGAICPVLFLGKSLLVLGSGLGRYHALPAFDNPDVLACAARRFGTWLGWYVGYGGWPLLLLLALGVLLAVCLPRHRTVTWCAAGGWVLSLGIGSLFYNNSYARYSLPDNLILVVFVSLVFGDAWKTSARGLVLAGGIAALLRWGLVDWRIGNAPDRSAIPAADIIQYVTGPWSGRGTTEVRRWLDDYADRHNVHCLVLTHRALRPGCYALMLAERGDPCIGVIPFTIYEPSELEVACNGLRYVTHGRAVAFFLLYEGSLYPAPPWLDRPGGRTHLVHSVNRGEAESFRLYQFEP